MIEFSVIIVSYIRLDIIIKCLDSIANFNDIGDRLEVIVVDNSPHNIIFNHVRDNYPWVRMIKNENKGFGEGNNIGARNANGKYLLFLNPDTILIEPIFTYAIDKFDRETELAAFGVKLVDNNLNRNMSFYFLNKVGLMYAQLIKLCNIMDIYIDGHMFIAGADIFIKKDAFFECGMFDENIFMYYEEPDLIRRIKKLNKKTNYYKDKKIIHLEGKTTNNNKFALTQRLNSLRYYCNKYSLNYNKKLASEIRYSYFKLLIYKVFNNNQNEICRNNIKILKEFKNKKY